ncbi:MAG: hypothetical protein QXT63_03450 [Thermoplasmata archaeon]
MPEMPDINTNEKNENEDAKYAKYESWEDRITFGNRFLFRLGIILAQIVIILAMSSFVRNSRVMLYMIVAISFLPPIVAIFLSKSKGFLVCTLGILIITQHWINSFSHPSYAYAWGSDGMNDLHVARVLASNTFFELGQVGYTERSPDLSFYLYPHLFLVTFSNIVGVDLYFTANFLFPIINGILVSYGLFGLYGVMFNFSSFERGLGVILYTTCFYFDFFQSFFVRETFAFPIALIFLGLVLKHSKIYKERPFFERDDGAEKEENAKNSTRKFLNDGGRKEDIDKKEKYENNEKEIEDRSKNKDAQGYEKKGKNDEFTTSKYYDENSDYDPDQWLVFIIILGLGIIVSHHFTSYLMLLILISLSFYSIFTRVKDTQIFFITSIFALILVVWIANVTITLALQQGYATWASVQSVLMGTRSGSSGSTIMADSYVWEKYLTYLYYGIFFIFAAYGLIIIIRKCRGSYTRFFVILCIGLLLFSTAARLTTSDKWTYNLAVRAMTWLYIGSAPLLAFSICRFVNCNPYKYHDNYHDLRIFSNEKDRLEDENGSELKHKESEQGSKQESNPNTALIIFVIFLVLVLSFGYFAQYYPGVKVKAGSEEEKLSNPYFNYRAAIWLDLHSQNGSLLLYDKNNTELCYSFEPYSNTVLFHHEHYYTNFEGYIPIYIGEESEFQNLQNLREVDIIYDNGKVKIAYTQGGISGGLA